MPQPCEIVARNLRHLFDAAQRGVIDGPTTFLELERWSMTRRGMPIARKTARRATTGTGGHVRIDVLARLAEAFRLTPAQLLTPGLKPDARAQGSTPMPRKRPPPPFGPLHRDYAESLEAVLLAAGMLADTADTLLKLGAITAGADGLAERVAQFRRAWDGEAPKEPAE